LKRNNARPTPNNAFESGPPSAAANRGCVNERAQLLPAVQIWANSAMPWLRALSTVRAHAEGMASPEIDSPFRGLENDA
jgi:hypothetical protein